MTLLEWGAGPAELWRSPPASTILCDSAVPSFISVLGHKLNFLGCPSRWRGIKNEHFQSSLIFRLLIPLKKNKKRTFWHEVVKIQRQLSCCRSRLHPINQIKSLISQPTPFGSNILQDCPALHCRSPAHFWVELCLKALLDVKIPQNCWKMVLVWNFISLS